MYQTLPTLLLVIAALLLGACDARQRHAPLPPDSVVLAFGDSITHGTGAGTQYAFPTLLAARTGWQVINAGVPGDTALAARERLAPLLEEHTPALVILELGGNDFLRRRGEADVEADLAAIIAAIRARDIPVVLVAVPRFSVLRATVGALNDAELYERLGEEDQVLLVPDLLSEVLSEEQLRSDRIHPNAAGHSALADGLYDALEDSGFIP